jgi:hypothetical protein
MKILLRLTLCSPDLSRELAADPELSKSLGARPNGPQAYLFPKFFDASGQVLTRVLQCARDHGETLSLLRNMEFSTAEINTASHLELVCRSTIAQSGPDINACRAVWSADSLHPTASQWCVRLPPKIYLTKVVPPSTIALVDQWTGEYAFGAEAAQALRCSRLTGWALAPVLHPVKAAPTGTGYHLSTSALLPAALQDHTRITTYDDGPRQPSQPRRYGLLSYAAGALAYGPDFARTAEPWGPWRTPQWVVRQAVRQWFVANALRGWAFWPVLEEGTALHADHLRRWEETLERLAGAGASIAI